MMKTSIRTAILIAFALPAYAQQTAAPQSGAQPSPTPAADADTRQFAVGAATTNLFEIQAGQLAQTKTQATQVQSYAKMIVEDHQKAQDELKSAAAKVPGIQLPTTLDQAHQQMIAALLAASGPVFLEEFKGQQVQGHQEAVQVFQNYAETGTAPALKALAQTSLPMLQKHLMQAQSLPVSEPMPTAGSGGSNAGGSAGNGGSR